MGHQMQDRLLPNESLGIGDALVSSDGRFRLQFHPATQMFAFFAYTVDDGVVVVADIGAFSEASMELPQLGGLILRNTQGAFLGQLPVDPQGLNNHFFVLQSDGNLVQYMDANQAFSVKNANSVVFLGVAVEPNRPVVEIVPNAGTLVLSTGPSDADLFNGSGRAIGARDGNNYVVIDNGASVPLKSAGAPGTVLVTVQQYNFTDLQTAGTRTQRQQLVGSTSADAVPTGSTDRPQISIGPGGLSLTGHRTHKDSFMRKKHSHGEDACPK